MISPQVNFIYLIALSRFNLAKIRGHHTGFFHRFSLLKKFLPTAFLQQPGKSLPSA
jgi:hypothetical protein